MPTRTLKRVARFTVLQIYNNLLSSLPGWSGGSVDDIESISWDVVNRNVVIAKKPEITANGFNQRTVTFTAAEIFALLSGLPGWSGGTAADINSIVHDTAGEKVVITRISESA